MAYHHLGEVVHRQALKYKHRTAIKYQDPDGRWIDMSWKTFSANITNTAQSMAEIGVKPGDNLGVYSQNMEKYLITDFAAYANRAVMVPMYATASPAQVSYIVQDAAIRILFVGEQFQYNNAWKVQQESPLLEKLIIFDRRVVRKAEDTSSVYFDDFIATGDNSETIALVNARLKQLREQDMATIIYTSGTTGEPKGVMLTHANYMKAMVIHDQRITGMSDRDLSMCFLPLTHIFEKAWTYYCLHMGTAVAINRDPNEIRKNLKVVRPTLMSNVPRFWEKVYDGVQETIENASGVLKWFFRDAVTTGRRHNLEYRNEGKRPPLANRLKFFFYQHTIFYLIKRVVGIDRGNFFPVAGAPLSDTINRFMQSIDVHLIYGYGLSETTATVSCFPAKGFRIGTVGKVMPDIEVKIGENSEILVKGDTVMKGYYNKPEATAEVFTGDGFFRTGDAGLLTENNEIILTERIKDLYKTSNGKYIAPQMIETRISEDKYIDQVAVIGDDRKFVSALVVPNYEALKTYATERKISFHSVEELLQNEEIIDFVFGQIELLQSQFTSYEKIKRITLLPQPFSMEQGELTNTLKLRRKVILEHYHDHIEQMYNG
ncbi:MAG: long-chain fatty acid--CoA ligase [Proteiniphilum sp.]|jgi:long-chain acyl-CoA synthetase|nr:long-chain fatty acid--CoA ligase [Proteiniphilum sp.]NCD14844.1 long-chain fatty acid--CoA ligase [Bacteroidia bacterium]HHT34492.1 long-chain fatty acid--CoA ligase [Bacteroidales bacterium]MDD2725687.1 long-chain fatty acid--CoA ligase [Proteiniphilum sp.]MDD3331877.1 long-chain fatty acid--CoA ligase [Proteiniphilum sp.]